MNNKVPKALVIVQKLPPRVLLTRPQMKTTVKALLRCLTVMVFPLKTSERYVFTSRAPRQHNPADRFLNIGRSRIEPRDLSKARHTQTLLHCYCRLCIFALRLPYINSMLNNLANAIL